MKILTSFTPMSAFCPLTFYQAAPNGYVSGRQIFQHDLGSVLPYHTASCKRVANGLERLDIRLPVPQVPNHCGYVRCQGFLNAELRCHLHRIISPCTS